MEDVPAKTMEEIGLSGGALAGIALGSIVGAVALLALGLFLFIKFKGNAPEQRGSLMDEDSAEER
jgi:hypothetical protein